MHTVEYDLKWCLTRQIKVVLLVYWQAHEKAIFSSHWWIGVRAAVQGKVKSLRLPKPTFRASFIFLADYHNVSVSSSHQLTTRQSQQMSSSTWRGLEASNSFCSSDKTSFSCTRALLDPPSAPPKHPFCRALRTGCAPGRGLTKRSHVTFSLSLTPPSLSF